MGNVFSCCRPCEPQDEGQRLLHESVPSPQTSTNLLENCPVSTTPESSETPSPADEKVTDQLKADLPLDTSQPELVPGQAAVQVETDVLATPGKPDASAVCNNVQMYAVGAVDNTTAVEQQETAAGVVSQVLADATKIDSASGKGGTITSLASQTQDVPSGGDESIDALYEKAEIKVLSLEKLEGAATMTSSEAAVIGVESQSVSTPIKSPNVSTDKVESLDTKVSCSQAEGEAGCTTIKSQAVPTEKLESQDTVKMIENHAAAATSESQAATENLENHISAIVIDSLAASTITENQAVSYKIVPEPPGCSFNTEVQHSLAKISETIPPRTPEKKEAFAELQQVPVVCSNGSLAEGVLVREKAEDVILIQELLPDIKPAAMEVNLLSQNSSAEENEQNKSLNETPKELSPTPETHVQFGLPAQLDDPSAARDGEPEEEQAAVSDVEDNLTESVPPHCSDGGHRVSLEGSFPEGDLELSSPPTDNSASAEDSEEKKRTDGDSELIEEPCNGEDISVTSEKEVHTEMRDSAADSDAQDVVGLTTVSSLEDVLEDKGMSEQNVDTGIVDGGLAPSLQDEKPGSTDRLSPVESDGNEINCEEDLYRGEEEIKEEQGNSKVMEMTVSGLEDRCSLEPPMAILTYSEREWKGQTTKSAVIRKGYTVLSQSFGCLRRVRGDNYCALRATLYQALMNTTQLPDWLQQESLLLIPEELEARYGLIKGWRFPDMCKQINGTDNAVDLLKHYLSLLLKWWHEAATSSGLEGHMRVCDELFQGGVDEFGLMEALKLLMLARAVELHTAMQSGEDVPIFCWLLFARDSSSCPRTLVANHLSQMGFSGGLEQVEMFLLGYALCHTIKAYRLYMADTEEFITHYPDDHIQDWPCLCLVTEDDRHYNVVVGNPAQPQEDPPAGLQ